MKSQSIIRRTMFLVLSTELLCAIAFSASALSHERHTRMRAFDIMLQGRSDSVLGALQDADDPGDNLKLDAAELKVPPGDTFAVYNIDGGLLGSSNDAPEALLGRGRSGFSNREVDGRKYRVFERSASRTIDPNENGGKGFRRTVTIVYAAQTAHIHHEILEAAGYYTLVGILLLAVTALMLVLLLRKVLHPLEELAVRAGGISAEALHFEPPASALQVRELAPLAQALSETVSRLRRAFEHEQRFVGDAAHELKTAVAVVRSTIQVLAMRSRSREEYVQGLDDLLKDNQRVEDLVARMLTLARMEQPGEREMNTIDLGDAMKATVQNLSSFAQAHSVNVTFEVEENISVRLSVEKAHVLISNLIVNAVQHSNAGGDVTVKVTRTPSHALLQVKDTGAGIAASAIPHIFERFYREDTSRSRDTGGAGLGLAICKSIVQSAGGTITMESAPGIQTIATASFSLS